ncbi:MAG TPA: YbhB/YbcL family Raf kinase inhibitor-like protein [Steroidobacteraceae bacterium]|nr:YbhB/YbcL family Raf kinase inhibitor-like protein [Steroidobacteraceae bacterium]
MQLSKLTLALLLAAMPFAGAAPTASFTLSSPDFPANGQMPEPFVYNAAGCTGGNISPALKWTGVPAGTKSFVITLFDEDEHGTPSGWWHWIVYDIPGTSTGLPRGAGAAHSLPAGALHGRGDDGSEAYSGPCPDAGDPAHRYLFTIYALKVDKLPVAPGSSGAMVTYAVHEYTLAKATLIARHRNTKSP